jgi:hypothetical protein
MLGGGEDSDGHHDTFSSLSGLHTSQLGLYTIYRVYDNCRFSYNYFVTGEDDKVDCSIPDNTTLVSTAKIDFQDMSLGIDSAVFALI